jgi:hypothetical protein
MSALKDLRELVNVSRLTYREGDSDTEQQPDTTQYDDFKFDSTKANIPVMISKKDLPPPVLKKKPLLFDATILSPIKSRTVPNQGSTPSLNKAARDSYVISSIIENPASSVMLKSRDSLLDRRSILSSVQFNNIKKSLPPLNTSLALNLKLSEEFGAENDDNDDESKSLDRTIGPLRDEAAEDPSADRGEKETTSNGKSPGSSVSNGNFDHILTFIDASVVSDWLNRANKCLGKLFRWHQNAAGGLAALDEDSSRSLSASNNNKQLKYESYSRFCNFWLGGGESRFSDKQRRELIKMEYSIIGDEIMQAFHAGIESQHVSLNDVNMLMRAVFREYPLQMLSFRGGYLILDFVDILSSDRDDDYKRLLSDVKCRTVNRQCAQWVLSIRSFSLVNLCWSIVKFYKKSVEQQAAYKSTSDDVSRIGELDGRLSSLSVQNRDADECKYAPDSSAEGSDVSSDSSAARSTSRSESSKSAPSSAPSKAIKKKRGSQEGNAPLYTIIPNSVKYEYYLEAVIK